MTRFTTFHGLLFRHPPEDILRTGYALAWLGATVEIPPGVMASIGDDGPMALVGVDLGWDDYAEAMADAIAVGLDVVHDGETRLSRLWMSDGVEVHYGPYRYGNEYTDADDLHLWVRCVHALAAGRTLDTLP